MADQKVISADPIKNDGASVVNAGNLPKSDKTQDIGFGVVIGTDPDRGSAGIASISIGTPGNTSRPGLHGVIPIDFNKPFNSPRNINFAGSVMQTLVTLLVDPRAPTDVGEGEGYRSNVNIGIRLRELGAGNVTWIQSMSHFSEAEDNVKWRELNRYTMPTLDKWKKYGWNHLRLSARSSTVAGLCRTTVAVFGADSYKGQVHTHEMTEIEFNREQIN